MKLALYQPDIAQNVGTLLRTAACFGVDVDIIEPCGFPFDDRKFKRAGMDYIHHVHYQKHASWEQFKQNQESLPSLPRIILLSAHAATPYTEFSFREDDILLLGRETAGVPDAIRDSVDARVIIPMQAGMRSLNVAISGAIVLSEAIRQTNLKAAHSYDG